MGKKKEEASMYNFRIVAKGWHIRVPLRQKERQRERNLVSRLGRAQSLGMDLGYQKISIDTP